MSSDEVKTASQFGLDALRVIVEHAARIARERYESCAHRLACDRMAEMARLPVWYSSAKTADESVAYAYICDACREWEKKETA